MKLLVIELGALAPVGGGADRLPPAVLAALSQLAHAGCRLVLTLPAPEQSAWDVQASLQLQQRLHQQLAELGTPLEAIFFHEASAGVDAVKAWAALLQDVLQRCDLDPGEVYLLAARPDHLDAARTVGIGGRLPAHAPVAAAAPEHAGSPALPGLDDFVQDCLVRMQADAAAKAQA